MLLEDILNKHGVFKRKLPNDDMTGSPGPKNLIAGDMRAGYFGEVAAKELWDGTELSSEVGITLGTFLFPSDPWLKFAYQGQIYFRSKRPYKYHNMSSGFTFSYLEGFVDTILEKNGIIYSLDIIEGNKQTGTSTANIEQTEWNKLMIPLAVGGEWGTNLSLDELHIGKGNRVKGAGHIAKPTRTLGKKEYWAERGLTSISSFSERSMNTYDECYGWSPVLKVIEE